MKTLMLLAAICMISACSEDQPYIEPDRDEYEMTEVDIIDIDLCEMQGGIVEFNLHYVACVFDTCAINGDALGGECTAIGEAYSRD